MFASFWFQHFPYLNINIVLNLFAPIKHFIYFGFEFHFILKNIIEITFQSILNFVKFYEFVTFLCLMMLPHFFFLIFTTDLYLVVLNDVQQLADFVNCYIKIIDLK